MLALGSEIHFGKSTRSLQIDLNKSSSSSPANGDWKNKASNKTDIPNLFYKIAMTDLSKSVFNTNQSPFDK